MSELKDIKNSFRRIKAASDLASRHAAEMMDCVDATLEAEKPDEPDVYEQIEERYETPFSELTAPAGYFFVFMAGLEEQPPVFRRANSGERYMCIDGTLGIGKNMQPRLILRPAKRVVFVEDPKGKFVRVLNGEMQIAFPDCDHLTRYRREES